MKMKQEHYDKINEAIKEVLANNPTVSVESYAKAGLSPMRFRWDCLWYSKVLNTMGDNALAYLNDSHIDTALRFITGTKDKKDYHGEYIL